jgi:predicted RecA/RadA family phage recombinase
MANYLYGDPQMVPHTPVAAVTAGAIIVTVDTPRIAHVDIAVGVQGDLAAEGGVYSELADGAIAADRKVYWDAAASRVTLTAGANKVLGVTTTATSGAGQLIQFRHDPAA